MVSLMTRLVSMIEEKDEIEDIQAVYKINGFRNRIKEEKFKGKLERFCKGKGRKILNNLWDLLTTKKYGLPRTLAAEISQAKTEDMMLLIIYWLYLLGDDFNKLKNDDRKRSLGFITAVAWFANDPKQCAADLTKELIELNKTKPKKLKQFFNHERYKKILTVTEKSSKIKALPIISPKQFTEHVIDCVIDNPNFINLNKDSEIWRNTFWH